ncbi:MAG: hypothetical protein SFY32_13665 [Bacteroidota bacterium]|nr:hypothetical protein [Bacteroidota bacterium]
MKLNTSNRFISYLSITPIETQKKVIEVVEIMKGIKQINELKTQTLVGFPFIHVIQIENYSLCFSLSKDEIELLGIVESGKELPLIT